MGEIELGAAAEATIMAYKELASDPGKRLALALVCLFKQLSSFKSLIG